jgi:hypothetical protein
LNYSLYPLIDIFISPNSTTHCRIHQANAELFAETAEGGSHFGIINAKHSPITAEAFKPRTLLASANNF